MILVDGRGALDDALSEDVSICVLVGTEESDAGSVHACMDEGEWGENPWHRWFLVTDPDLLTEDEREHWFDGDPAKDYAFLGRTTKEMTSSGRARSELLEDGGCDYLTYIEKFAEADLS